MFPVKNLEHYQAKEIISIEEASKLALEFKNSGKTVGLCQGCFDICHPGQIKHLESAKNLCDVLMVSLNSDKFVSSRKGSGKPVFTDKLRAYMIASLGFVDYVVITNHKLAVEAIKALKPSYYIKGPDFINKTTPGISSEREAIKQVGGEMKYTSDPKLSATNIINYIKQKVDIKNILIAVDRDGTLVEEKNFLGKEENWKEKVNLKENVISLLSYLQTKYQTTKIVISNQAGVARQYFDCKKVEEINDYIHNILKLKGVIIDNWQYCPDVDLKYTESQGKELRFDRRFVKGKTKRKPSSDMLHDGIKKLKKDISEFDYIIVIGDQEVDRKLAENIKGIYIDSDDKYEDAVRKIESVI